MSAAISDLSPARYLGELRLEEDISQAGQSDSPAPLEEVGFREDSSIFVKHQSPDMEWTEVLTVAGRGASPEAGMAAGLAALESALADQGLELSSLVRVVLYVADMAAYPAINRAYSQHFGSNPPVRVCVAVGRDNLQPGASFYLVFIIF